MKTINTIHPQGDSGGPLMYLEASGSKPYMKLIGVVSWGSGCGSDNPGVYARVTSECLEWEPENSTKTLKPGFAKYAVDANLFRLGSTNPKKNYQPLDAFFLEGRHPLSRVLDSNKKKYPGAGNLFFDWWTLVGTG